MLKFIIADPFVKALTEAGHVPRGTTAVYIRAVVGEPITISTEVLADDGAVMSLVESIGTTDDPGEAGIAK